jgi:UDP:flavonoid glycosyltransferase YjiC (YdhE family)
MKLLIPLFSPATGTWGGLTRGIAIAQAAERAGHTVAFCASGYLETALRKRGYQVYATPPTTMLGLPTPLSRLLERRSQRVSIPIKPGRSIGSIWLVLFFSGLARPSYLRLLAAAEINAVRHFQADKLFTDLDPGAFLTSAISGLPLASTYAHIATQGSGSWPWKLMRRAIAPVLQSDGLPAITPDELFFGDSVLKIIPSIPELDGTDPNRSDVRYVGQLLGPIKSLAAIDFQLGTNQRCVYVYVGTGSISLDRLQSVLPSVFPTHGDRVCLVGAQSISHPYQLQAVDFRPYVPAELVLPQCDWTICHGGQNTITQSLVHNVPLLIFPGPIFERRYNAKKVEETGAGRMGEVTDFSAEWLQTAFEKRSEYVHEAAVLGANIRSYGGAPAAVEAISNWTGPR